MQWWDRMLAGRLTTPAWAICFLIVAVACGLLAWFLKRKDRRLWLVPLVIAIVALLIGIAAGLNTYFGWRINIYDLTGKDPAPPEINQGEDWPSDTSRGVHVNAMIPGPLSGIAEQPADIWLPPQYFTQVNRPLPLIYAYHGTPGTPDDWFNDGDGQQSGQVLANERQPVILVAPTAAPVDVDSECVNGTAGNWDTYLSQDVPNWVAQRYRLKAGPGHTATAGLSMGGYCAQMLALRYPDKFSAAGNFSGTTSADFAGGLPALFGPVPNLAATTDSYSSTWLIQHHATSRNVAVWLEVGTNDSESLVKDQAKYYKLAKSITKDTRFKTIGGAHTKGVWSDAFYHYLEWVYPKIK